MHFLTFEVVKYLQNVFQCRFDLQFGGLTFARGIITWFRRQNFICFHKKITTLGLKQKTKCEEDLKIKRMIQHHKSNTNVSEN